MGVFYGPLYAIVTNGLVLNLDTGKPRSYPGSGTTWYDISGNGNNGTLVNSPTYSSNYGGSLLFNPASSQYVTPTGLTDAFWQATEWTANFWVYFNSINTENTGTNDKVLLQHGSAAISKGLHLDQRNSRFYFGLYSNDLSGVQTISTARWYNVTYTLNNSTFLKQIYVNGSLDASGTGSAAYTGTGSNSRIGGPAGLGFGVYFDGYINVCQFYNRVLSATEITQNYTALRSRFGL